MVYLRYLSAIVVCLISMADRAEFQSKYCARHVGIRS
jgi:hypothetical protein